MEEKQSRFKPEFYKNRELSWLQFEERVLDEARQKDNPLFERLKFLSITGSNLDEFFMIRVASLKGMVNAGIEERDIAGLTPREQLSRVSDASKRFIGEQYALLNDELIPELEQNGIKFVSSYAELDSEDKKLADSFYRRHLKKRITPILVKEGEPFARIRNNEFMLGALLKTKDGKFEYGFVTVPSVGKRICVLSDREDCKVCIPVERIIKSKFEELFPSHEVISINPFRVIRNADLSISELENDEEDILHTIEKQVERREYGEAIRLEIGGKNPEGLKERLEKELSITEEDVYVVGGPIDLTFLMEIYNFDGYDKLRRPEYIPVMPWEFEQKRSMFDQIKEKNLMLIHPFESFKPVVDFIAESARDENVLEIKQTLYRVSGNSPIVNALAHASKNGKKVTVLVELKARFDEEHNIGWARMLEKAGCNVIYGFASLKTHCKITLVVRKEGDAIKRYVHLGTGNYNDTTAKLYTDISFFTAIDEYGIDAENVFNMLSGKEEPEKWNKLYLAPKSLRKKFLELIKREAEHAVNGRPAHIVAKVNSLCDKEIIDALYEASCKGVNIDLIVRGICCLKTGIPGVSENITVRSIVGNFLEHSRVFYFKNGGDPEYFCSSADWMPRNMDRRIEILFPVERGRLREKLNHVLKLMLKDNRNAWILREDGSYARVPEEENLYSFQEGFCEEEHEIERK